MKTFQRILFALLVTVVSAASLGAQSSSVNRSDPTGIMFGAHLNGSAISWEDADDVESGGGFGLMVGYGFSRLVTLYLAADGASISSEEGDAYTLGHGDLGLRFHLGGPEKAALFYLDGAYSARLAREEVLGSDLDVSGAGAALGGGLEYFFSPDFALDVGLRFNFGSFDEASYDGDSEEIDVGATTTRFNLGVTWYPAGS